MQTTRDVPVVLMIPADPTFVRLVRLVISAMAADNDYDIEQVEDLRIAADELVNVVINSATAGSYVEIRLSANDEIGLEVSAPTDDEEASLDQLSREIVAAVTASFHVGVEGRRVIAGFQSTLPRRNRAG
jgi:hypothetical protein